MQYYFSRGRSFDEILGWNEAEKLFAWTSMIMDKESGVD